MKAVLFTHGASRSSQEFIIKETCFEIELEFGVLGFVEVGKLDIPEKTLEQG